MATKKATKGRPPLPMTKEEACRGCFWDNTLQCDVCIYRGGDRDPEKDAKKLGVPWKTG